MNKRKKIINDNALLRQLEFRSRHGKKEGCVRIHKANTLEHETVKMQLVYWLLKNGYKVFTEVEFRPEYGSGRADIIAIQNGVGYCIEVLHSEKEEKYLEKQAKYPEEFTLVPVRTSEWNYEEFCL